MTNETTPDAVERQYQDSDGNPCDLATLCRREPGWAANRIDTLLAERARHAEEVARLRDVHLDETRALDDLLLKEIASLRDQLRRVEGERDAERKHATEMEERALDLVRDLRLANVELASLRSLLPDVRACAEYCRNILIGPPGLAPVALAARRILAALDSQGGEGE